MITAGDRRVHESPSIELNRTAGSTAIHGLQARFLAGTADRLRPSLSFIAQDPRYRRQMKAIEGGHRHVARWHPPDTCSPMSPEISIVLQPCLTEPCWLIRTRPWRGLSVAGSKCGSVNPIEQSITLLGLYV